MNSWFRRCLLPAVVIAGGALVPATSTAASGLSVKCTGSYFNLSPGKLKGNKCALSAKLTKL